MLPASLELNGTAVFGDGGTVGLACELPDSTEIRINLPPANCSVYPDRKPQLYMQVYYPDSRTSESYSIAIRSELESQVLSLLKNSQIEYRLTRLDRRAMEHHGDPVEVICEEKRVRYNDDIRRTRDGIIAFLESDEYVTLNQ